MIYAFDFDGVLIENHDELPYFTKVAWENTTGRKCKAKPRDIIKFRPWVKNAAEIYGLVLLLEKGVKITKEKIKQATASNKSASHRFTESFFSERQRMQTEERERWLKFYRKFDFAVRLFNSLAKDRKIYIVASKDKKTISNLARHFVPVIDDENILAREISFDKLHHMDIIRKNKGVGYNEIVFIEEALDHLISLKKKGVCTILASWGYATKDDIKEAKRLGIEIATKKNFENMIRNIDSTEFFDVIDKNNKVIGKAPRDECHKKGLLHRAIHIMILNSKGEILLQKRSKKKDLYSGWWTSSASGHVEAGDDYEESAHRELKEELGVEAKLEPLFAVVKDYRGQGKHDRERIQVYIGQHDGPFNFSKEEVESVKFFPPETIAKMMIKEKFTPGTVDVLRELKKRPELLKRLGLQ